MAKIQCVDQFNFHHVLEQTRGPALVFFTGPYCGACHTLRRVLAAYLGTSEDLQVFEVDAERDPGLAREFEVFHLPSLFLYVDGRYHCELQSEPRVPEIARAIAVALKQPPREAP